jgi:hypothetical protein
MLVSQSKKFEPLLAVRVRRNQCDMIVGNLGWAFNSWTFWSDRNKEWNDWKICWRGILAVTRIFLGSDASNTLSFIWKFRRPPRHYKPPHHHTTCTVSTVHQNQNLKNHRNIFEHFEIKLNAFLAQESLLKSSVDSSFQSALSKIVLTGLNSSRWWFARNTPNATVYCSQLFVTRAIGPRALGVGVHYVCWLLSWTNTCPEPSSPSDVTDILVWVQSHSRILVLLGRSVG